MNDELQKRLCDPNTFVPADEKKTIKKLDFLVRSLILIIVVWLVFLVIKLQIVSESAAETQKVQQELIDKQLSQITKAQKEIRQTQSEIKTFTEEVRVEHDVYTEHIKYVEDTLIQKVDEIHAELTE